jgi:hypothetical protein
MDRVYAVIRRVTQVREGFLEEFLNRVLLFVAVLNHCDGDQLIGQPHADASEEATEHPTPAVTSKIALREPLGVSTNLRET